MKKETTYVMSPAPFFGKNIFKKILSLYGFFKETAKMYKLLNKRFDFLFGTGGYVCFPGFFASILRRIPFFILEENVLAGRTTRIFKRFSKKTFYGLGEKSIGNPVRKEIENASLENPSLILVIGGSQGAKRLNELAFEIAERFKSIRVVLIKGKWEIPKRRPMKNLEIIRFTDAPWSIYKKTKIAIARAGAMTISELLCMGIPTIFIPFPYAVDNHQYYNALFVYENDAGFLVEEKELFKVFDIIEELLTNERKWKTIRKNALSLAKKNSSLEIIKEIKKCLEE